MRAMLLSLLAGSLFVAGCAGSPSLRAAEAGQFSGLAKKVADEVRRGSLGPGDAHDLALIVARGEARHASGPDGIARIRQLEACARHVDAELEVRSGRGDEIGAEAAMVRLESGLEPPAELASRVESASSAWRAVGARALVGDAEGDTRRSLMTDGDEGVRLGALRAAGIARDPRDAEILLEASRVDPLPLARTGAIRAAGALGGERVVLALKDLWVLADEPDREAIADAWASPRSLDAGGRRELSWAADTQHGGPAIAAASALTRSTGAGFEDALGVLQRAIKDGPSKDRVFAILVAPLTSTPIRDAVINAESDDDEQIAIAAMGRMLEAAPEQGGAQNVERAPLVHKLLEHATGASTHAIEAKGALARGRAREVIPLLEVDVVSTDRRVREVAGAALAELGELPYAAIAAADDDPHIRVSTACAILNRTARR